MGKMAGGLKTPSADDDKTAAEVSIDSPKWTSLVAGTADLVISGAEVPEPPVLNVD